MNKQEVDALVQNAIENIRAGRIVEDDTGIECKSLWPEPSKARQLAGAANALRGEPLVYVIGVKDSNGEITTPEKREPQEWYSQMKKRFDQVAPELLWTQTVFVGAPPESVVALVFDTSEYPYVVKAENPRLEIPIRVGSGTQSAQRNQIIRMFEPSLRVPAMQITECRVRAEWEDHPIREDVSEPSIIKRRKRLELRIFARVLIEHFGLQPTILPIRDMRARLVCGEIETRPEVRVKPLGHPTRGFIPKVGQAPSPEPIPPQYGVYARDKHVISTAPGEFQILTDYEFQSKGEADGPLSEIRKSYAETDEMRLDLALRCIGVDRIIKLSTALHRFEPSQPAKSLEMAYGSGESAQLGAWGIAEPETDPWAQH